MVFVAVLVVIFIIRILIGGEPFGAGFWIAAGIVLLVVPILPALLRGSFFDAEEMEFHRDFVRGEVPVLRDFLLAIISYSTYAFVDLPPWANWFMWSHLAVMVPLLMLRGIGVSSQAQFNLSKQLWLSVACPWFAFINPVWWIFFWAVYGLVSLFQ